MRLTEEREWRRTLPPTIVAREGGGYLFRCMCRTPWSTFSGSSKTVVRASVSRLIATCPAPD